MTEKGKVFIVSGPSGSGKSTVLREVFSRRDHIWFSVSATTRAPRPGEEEGVDYFFMDRDRFEKMIRDGQFLEHAQFVGNYYGTPAGPVMEHLEAGDDVVLDIEIVGAAQVREKLPEAVSVFIQPPSMEELEHRLRKRSTETEEKIIGRLERARREFAERDKYDHVVINDDFVRAAGEFIEIMDREKAKTCPGCEKE